MSCQHIIYSNCPKGHRQQWKCEKGPPVSCSQCDRNEKIAEKKRQEEFALQEKRDAAQRLHAQKMAELNSQISQRREALRDTQLSEERNRALRQKEKDLGEVTVLASQASPAPQTPQTALPILNMFRKMFTQSSDQPKTDNPSQTKEHAACSPIKSVAREDWRHQKDVDGAMNDAIDAIMEMTGLEDVKAQVLRIKNKVDTTKRQNSALTGERFNVSMLGNPGTGTFAFAVHRKHHQYKYFQAKPPSQGITANFLHPSKSFREMRSSRQLALVWQMTGSLASKSISRK